MLINPTMLKGGGRASDRRGFTLMEIMAVLLIMSICAVVGLDSIATFEANERAERGAREALAYFRYARHLAVTTGKSAKVEINTTAKTVAVYWMSNGTTWDATPVTHSMASGGQLQLNFATSPEIKGTTISVSPATTSFIFSSLGACETRATITFTFGNKAKTLVIPMVGDPQVY
jgi:prepilin-type N-terminal cleavage/methylation domain-containing protein